MSDIIPRLNELRPIRKSLETQDEGLRYNDGKVRHDLLEPFAINELAKVFTFGSNKYAPYNWLKGMKWSKVLASLKRHISAFEQGEDFDKETGLPHMAHAGWNALALVSYMKYHPQGDDRFARKVKGFKVGLDIDGVLADFVGHLMKVSGNEGHVPIHWNDPIVRNEYEKIKNDKEFWYNIPPLLSKEDIPFEVHCYITARSIDVEVTKNWLDAFDFPKAPVYSIGHGESKIDIALKSGIDLFVDDSYSNYVELNGAGICTYLYDAPYNQKYEVGYKRINSLKELPV